MLNKNQNKKHVVLIVLDSMRKDYADKYIWPVLKERGFRRVETFVAPAAWTLPSHASIFTGLYPSEHGAHPGPTTPPKKAKLKPEFLPYLLRELKKQGFFTVNLTANAFISRYYGFTLFDKEHLALNIKSPKMEALLSKGELNRLRKISVKIKEKMFRSPSITTILKAIFSSIREEPSLLVPLLKYAFVEFSYFAWNLSELLLSFYTKWPLEKGVSRIKKLLKTLLPDIKEKNLFIFINAIEVHEPYKIYLFNYFHTIKKRLGYEDSREWKEGYIKALKYLAGRVRELIDLILDSAKDKQVLVIVTSDHGQLLGERGFYGHGYFLDDNLVFVPFYYFSNTRFTIRATQRFVSLKEIYNIILSFASNREGITLDNEYTLSEIFMCGKSGDSCHKIAVYFENYKGIFNVNKQEWECWKAYNERGEVPKEMKRKMASIVKQYLRAVLVRKKVRKLVPKGIKQGVQA